MEKQPFILSEDDIKKQTKEFWVKKLMTEKMPITPKDVEHILEEIFIIGWEACQQLEKVYADRDKTTGE